MNKYFSFIVLLIFWTIISKFINSLFFTWPIEILNEFIKIFQTKKIYLDIFYTLERVIFIIIFSSIVAIPLWIILWFYSKIYKKINFILDFFRTIPPIVFFPFFLILFWYWDKARICVWFFWTVIIYIMIIADWLIKKKYKKKYFSSLWLSDLVILKKIYSYEALKYIFIWLRIIIWISITIVIVTEMLASWEYWLWIRIQDFLITNNIESLFVMIFIIWIIWYFLNKITYLFEIKIIYWK